LGLLVVTEDTCWDEMCGEESVYVLFFFYYGYDAFSYVSCGAVVSGVAPLHSCYPTLSYTECRTTVFPGTNFELENDSLF
jgi:hypothetical protein